MIKKVKVTPPKIPLPNAKITRKMLSTAKKRKQDQGSCVNLVEKVFCKRGGSPDLKQNCSPDFLQNKITQVHTQPTERLHKSDKKSSKKGRKINKENISPVHFESKIITQPVFKKMHIKQAEATPMTRAKTKIVLKPSAI